MEHPAPVDHPVHEPIRRRWSPRAFKEAPVSSESLQSLFEAARWAPSSYNDQPWSFLLGRRGDATWDGILACLVPANRVWAQTAPVLLLALAHEDFVQTGKPNRHAAYDTGQAVANLAIEATARDLRLHQMAGFDADAARERFGIPPRQTPMTAIALGHGSDAEAPPPRERVPIQTFVFSERWGSEAELG